MDAKRCFTMALLSVSLVFGTAAAWWDGLDVELANYDRNYYAAGFAYQRAAEDLTSELREISVEELLSRCRLVVDAGLTAQAAHPNVPRPPGMPSRVDFLLCMAAMNRIGDTGDGSWLPVLEELSELWREAASVAAGWRGTPANLLLGTATVEAYRKIAFADTPPPAEIIRQWRLLILDPLREPARLGALHNVMRDLQRQTPPDPKFLEEFLKLFEDDEPRVRLNLLGKPFSEIPVEAYDARVLLIADPDPRVRERAGRVLLGGYLRPNERIATALLRLLARSDIDESVEETAVRALYLQGYKVRREQDGALFAVPINPERPSLDLSPDRPQSNEPH